MTVTEAQDTAGPSPSAIAVIFTCDDCAAEFFPDPPPRVSENGGPDDFPGDPHVGIVHASCAADFIADGFEIVPCDDGNPAPSLFCPHLDSPAGPGEDQPGQRYGKDGGDT